MRLDRMTGEGRFAKRPYVGITACLFWMVPVQAIAQPTASGIGSNGTPSLITFDVPGAGTAIGQGTQPVIINNTGVIVGIYVNVVGGHAVNQGFVRAANGDITTFDAPGSVRGTTIYGMNQAGIITGNYVDGGLLLHAFVRSTGGGIATFDAPGAGTKSRQGTTAYSINEAGDIVGYYIDASFVNHGFVRTVDGTFTTFDVPGASSAENQGTLGISINDAGAVAGYYYAAKPRSSRVRSRGRRHNHYF